MPRLFPRACLAVLAWAACQPAPEPAGNTSTAALVSPAPVPGSPEAKIAEAVSAAPAEFGAAAQIMDWPDSAGAQPKELRAGTNGWTCFPASPEPTGAVGQDPMCLDQPFQAWAGAWISKTKPAITSVGIGYMLQGDRGASNTDPYATGATADNQWVQAGPHVMIVVPNAGALESLPTDPKSGGPWVMWKGTPYAHVMVPVR